MFKTIEFKASGFKEAQEKIRLLGRRLSNFGEPLGETGDFFLKDIQRNFASQGSWYGEEWKPLTAMTKLIKRVEGHPETPLVRTGRMRSGFRYDKITSGKYKGIVLYNRMPYFKKHQSPNEADRMIIPTWAWETDSGVTYDFGPKKPLPRRVMLKLTKKNMVYTMTIFGDWVRRIFETALK